MTTSKVNTTNKEVKGMTIGTILKRVRTGEKVEIIGIFEDNRVMVKLASGEVSRYSMASLKDKRNFVIVEEKPDYTKEVMNQKEELGIEVPVINPEEVEIIPKEEESPKGTKARINITYRGETKTPFEWGRLLGLNPKYIRSQLRKGKTPEEIFKEKK